MRPENFIGIHFFSPVDKMELVEIIMGKKTSDDALAMAIDYVKQIKKTPIVVNDFRGFYTSRCFGTYVGEGQEMLAEGIAPAIIDNVGRMTGMPRGPLELADDVGARPCLQGARADQEGPRRQIRGGSCRHADRDDGGQARPLSAARTARASTTIRRTAARSACGRG